MTIELNTHLKQSKQSRFLCRYKLKKEDFILHKLLKKSTNGGGLLHLELLIS